MRKKWRRSLWGTPSELDRKLRVGRDRSQIILLPALVNQSQLVLVVGGQGDPHKSTKPPMGRAIGHRITLAEFLADKVRRLLETIGSRGEREIVILLSPSI